MLYIFGLLIYCLFSCSLYGMDVEVAVEESPCYLFDMLPNDVFVDIIVGDKLIFSEPGKVDFSCVGRIQSTCTYCRDYFTDTESFQKKIAEKKDALDSYYKKKLHAYCSQGRWFNLKMLTFYKKDLAAETQVYFPLQTILDKYRYYNDATNWERKTAQNYPMKDYENTLRVMLSEMEEVKCELCELHYAANVCNVAMVKAFVNAGADVKKLDFLGLTPYQIAEQSTNPQKDEIMTLLKEAEEK